MERFTPRGLAPLELGANTVDMFSFDVDTDALQSASSAIGGTANGVEVAGEQASVAASSAGAFADEPIGATFSVMCLQGENAVQELQRTLKSLASCVQHAAEGYLVTDHGIVRAAAISGGVGTRGVPASPQGGGG